MEATWQNSGCPSKLASLCRIGLRSRPPASRCARQALQQIGAADQRLQRGHAQARQPLAGFRGDKGEEIDHHFDGTVEVVIPQLLVLGGDTGGAIIEVTDTQVLTSQRHHRGGTKAKALGAQDRGLDHIQSGLQAAVSLQPDRAAQAVAPQCLLHFRQPQLKGDPA